MWIGRFVNRLLHRQGKVLLAGNPETVFEVIGFFEGTRGYRSQAETPVRETSLECGDGDVPWFGLHGEYQRAGNADTFPILDGSCFL